MGFETELSTEHYTTNMRYVLTRIITRACSTEEQLPATDTFTHVNHNVT